MCFTSASTFCKQFATKPFTETILPPSLPELPTVAPSPSDPNCSSLPPASRRGPATQTSRLVSRRGLLAASPIPRPNASSSPSTAQTPCPPLAPHLRAQCAHPGTPHATPCETL